MTARQHDFSKLDKIIDQHPKSPQSLIMVLQDIQTEYNYLPCDALHRTAEKLDVPMSKVFSVSTFYNAFSLNKRGKKLIRICVGTACHIRGSRQIQEHLEEKLGIKAGQTTKDEKVTLEVVSCVGACALAPVMMVDEKTHGSVKLGRVSKLIGKS